MSGDRRCPACGASVDRVVADFGEVPVYCNVLWPDRESAREARRGEIRLGLCEQCGLIHNLTFDPSRVEYTSDYENSLHFSPRFDQYARALANDLVERHGVRDKQVIDIGCGKGDFLRLLCEAGDNTGLGFDASFEPELANADDPFRVVRDLFTTDYADEAADLICCRHVLEHIDAPGPFLAHVRNVAANRKGSVVFFEVPNAQYMVDELAIWDIIYEHCTYYAPIALEGLFARSGLRPGKVYTTFDDQFLCIEAEVAEPEEPASSAPRVRELAASAERFGEHCRAKVERWQQQLTTWADEGRKVAVWGAGSKGVTFLNVAGGDRVSAVVDINPRKHGRFVAGAGLEVVSPDALTEAPVDIVLVMNPVYRDEIKTMLAERGLEVDVQVV